jgi:hypothetical protein
MDVASRRGTAGLPATRLWALTGFGLYVFGGLVMLFVSLGIAGAVLGSLGVESGAGTLGLSIRNSSHPIGWGAFVVAGSVPIGARLVPGLRFGAAGWFVLAVGLALAALTTFLDAEFVRARYGVYDPDYGGLTGFAGSALVAIALATWAALAVAGGHSRILAVLTVVATGGLIALLLPSVGAAADGIDAENVPIAAALTADALYGVVAGILVIRARPEPEH